ncbi:MAG: recombinase family protein [Ruminococcus sp.]
MSKIDYVRVSTEGQETARQEELMKNLDVEKVFLEKVSGKNTERVKFQKMMSYLREGDTLYVESISRLSRSIRDLLKTIDELNERGVKFVSQKENIDTNSPQGRFMLSVFAALSELEREQTLQRQREGIEIAKATGKYKGRKPIKIYEDKFAKLYKLWKAKEISAVEFQRKIGLKSNTFYRRIKEFELKNAYKQNNSHLCR